MLHSLVTQLRAVFSWMPPDRAAQVIPALKDHREDRLLGELHRRWNNHQVMTRWLSRFFNYLDRCGGDIEPLLGFLRSRSWSRLRVREYVAAVSCSCQSRPRQGSRVLRC